LTPPSVAHIGLVKIASRLVTEMSSDDTIVEHRAGSDAARLWRGLLGADYYL
jgi:hypothetical protein